MSRHAPEICWEDGLLLRPHHLQALQQRQASVVADLTAGRHLGWGVRRLEVRVEAVGAWVFEIFACDVIMPDGSRVISGETAVIQPFEFGHSGLDARMLDVWLCVPLLVDGSANVEPSDSPARERREYVRRYVRDRVELRDQSTGKNPQTIAVQKLNARIVIAEQPPAGHSAIKIAELRKIITEGNDGGRYEVSSAFVPASLTLDAAPSLHRIVKDVLNQVEEKNEDLARTLQGRSDLFLGESKESPRTLLALQATNAVLPVLRQIVAHPELHPFDVYLQLCRLVGDLAIFARDWRVPALELYRHADPLQSFEHLKKVALHLLDAAIDSNIAWRRFLTAEDGSGAFELELSGVFSDDTTDQIALALETGIDRKAIAASIADGSSVLASPAAIIDLEFRRLPGLRCEVDERLHPALERMRGFMTLVVRRDDPLWVQAKEAGRLRWVPGRPDLRKANAYLYAAGLRRAT